MPCLFCINLENQTADHIKHFGKTCIFHTIFKVQPKRSRCALTHSEVRNDLVYLEGAVALLTK